MMNTLALLNGLRFVDSFFPSGGFAFSNGLEAAVQDRAVRDGSGLARYVEELLVHGLARREAVAVAVAHTAEATGNLQTALKVDQELDALKIGRDTRQASRQMGRQIIKVAADQMLGHRVLQGYRTAVEERRTPGHVPVSLGLTLSACGWSRECSVAAFLYQTAQGFISAAMKLLQVGQQEGQLLLSRWGARIADCSRLIRPEEGLAT